MATTKFSVSAYTADGVTTDFLITWDYLDDDHIAVYVNNVSTSDASSTYKFDQINATTVRVTDDLGNPVASGISIEIRRETPISNRTVTFVDGSSLLADDLNKNSDYLLYAMQETIDTVDQTVKDGALEIQTATGLIRDETQVLRNETETLKNTTATYLATVQSDATDADNHRIAAEASETAAALSETNAAASATQAAASATSAATSSTNAAASAVAAATSETNIGNAEANSAASAAAAATSEANAATSATSAAASSSSANTSAGNASTSATQAASSAAAAATSEANAATSEAAANSSKIAAANSASAASTAAVAASASEDAAATSETNAAISASQSASSATASATSATNAASSESAAAVSASAASVSAANAAVSEANAAVSEANSLSSENSALNSANAASISETNAALSQSAAAASEAAASNSEANALVSETNASTSAANAATSEANAATSEVNAANSAVQASSSATAAGNAQTAAETARDQTLAAFDSFDDRYLGQKASAPTLDNDGNPLVAGALYFDTTAGTMQVYDGSAWVAAYASLSGALLVNNNLSDLSNVVNARQNLGLGSAALTDSTAYATAAQGALADSAVQPNDSPTFGSITVTGTVDGRDIATDGAKLDGIEVGATADQTIIAGSGLTGGGTGDVTISHADTSTQTSVNNSGRTFIQDITLDTYGHVTGIVSATDADTYTGTVTSVATGGGLTGGTITTSGTISHADTSAQGSVNNSGATVIQDVTLDTYGHVTGLGSKTLTGVDLFSVSQLSGASQSLDLSSSNFFSSSKMTGNITLSFSNVPTSAKWDYTIETDIINTWSLSSGTFVNEYSIFAEDGTPSGVWFKSDGTKMYVLGRSSAKVFQYSLSTAWDISTASYDSVSFSVVSQTSLPWGFSFKPDGTKMYMCGLTAETVYQYSLSTAWDISTASYDSKSFSIATQNQNPSGVVFKSDGTKMYVLATYSGDKVHQYSLSTAWDVSTASYDSIELDVQSQEYFAEDLFFKDDGTKLYVVGRGNDAVFQYSLSTAWDLSTASYDNISLKTPQTSGTSADPSGLYIASNGIDLYVVDYSTDTVRQYNIGAAGSITLPASVKNSPQLSFKSNRLTYTFFTQDGGTNVYLINEQVLGA